VRITLTGGTPWEDPARTKAVLVAAVSLGARPARQAGE